MTALVGSGPRHTCIRPFDGVLMSRGQRMRFRDAGHAPWRERRQPCRLLRLLNNGQGPDAVPVADTNEASGLKGCGGAQRRR